MTNGAQHPGYGLAQPPMPPGSPEPSRPRNRAALLGIILGSILLLGGTAVGLAFVFAGSGDPSTKTPGKDDQRQAKKDKPTDDTRILDGNARDNNTRDAIRPGDDTNRFRDDVGPDRDDTRKDNKPRDEKPKDDKPKDDNKDPATELTSLPVEEQKKVNTAIDKGVEYLKTHRNPQDGTWATGTYTVGFNALPALTLLECGVSKDDDGIQKILDMVRKKAPSLNMTYEISLAILLLDKVGDPKDKELIQMLALRLIAGQTEGGGWSYVCPIYNDDESKALMLALTATKPFSAKELNLEIRSKDSGSTDPEPKPNPDVKATFDKALKDVPDKVKKVQALQPPPDAKAVLPASDYSALSQKPSDNSNTQFALLGVWVAGRHGVPSERALALVARRFRSIQAKDGSWPYWYGNVKGVEPTPAMTCAGLLGLAVGHGLAEGVQREDAKRKKIDDPNVNRGLVFLSKHLQGRLGVPPEDRKKAKEAMMEALVDNNPYFLWSVERVGVLYNTKKIGDIDWYGWGSKLIVEQQANDGSWDIGGYHGTYPLLDTSFALLFLKRANLVKDLSSKLEFIIEAK
jgi:hypothetical protein